MMCHKASTVRAAALRRSAFSFANACSIGLKSGEYGGRYSRLAPAASMASRTPRILWLLRLMGWTPPTASLVPEWRRGRPLKEASVEQISTVGLDLAKQVFQAHGANASGAVVFRKKLRRGQVLQFLATLPPCAVA